jgi:Tfp pilus assembly protein PilE
MNKKGTTVLEVIIVSIIMAILVGFTVPMLKGDRTSTRPQVINKTPDIIVDKKMFKNQYDTLEFFLITYNPATNKYDYHTTDVDTYMKVVIENNPNTTLKTHIETIPTAEKPE